MSWLMKALFFLFTFFLAKTSFANNPGVSYQGRIFKPDGNPLEGTTVQFRMQVRSPGSENCLLYEEVQTLNMAGSSGVFALTLNDGTGTRLDTATYQVDRIFANRETMTLDTTRCATGTTYTPNSSDGRKLVVYFKDETMAAYEAMPLMNLNYVPQAMYALEAQKIDKFEVSSILRAVDGNGNPATAPALNPTQLLNLNTLLATPAANYVQTTSNGSAALPVVAGNPSSGLAAGQIWYDSGSNVMKYYDGAVKTFGTSGGGVTSVATGTGLTGGPITTTGTINVDVGVTTGKIIQVAASNKLPAIDGSNLTNITATDATKLPLAGGTMTGPLVNNSSSASTALAVTQAGAGYAATFMGGNVGIGTASPSFALQLERTTNSTILSKQTASDISGIAQVRARNDVSADIASGVLSSGNTLSTSLGASGDGFLYFNSVGKNMNIINDSTTGSMRFYNGSGATGTAVMALSGGNVGIGTTSPTALLSVRKDQDAVTNIRIDNITNGINAGSSLGLGNNVGNIGQLGTYSSSFSMSHLANRFSVASDTDGNGLDLMAWKGTGDMRFYTGGSATTNERIRITSTGNVGIGTNSPSANLHIERSSGSAKVLIRNTGTASTAKGFFEAWIDANASTGLLLSNGNAMWSAGIGFSSGGYTPDFYIQDTWNNKDVFHLQPGAANDTFFVSSTSRIGLGTNTPANKLDVEGSMAIGSAYSGSSAASADGLIVQGNVGIGTTAPGAMLQTNTSAIGTIGQIIKWGQAGQAANLLEFQNNTGTILSRVDKDGKFYGDGSGLTGITAAPSGIAGSVQFSNGTALASDNANLFWNDTNNRLGVGTATPSKTLQVNGQSLFGVNVPADLSAWPRLIISNDTGGAMAIGSPTQGDWGGGFIQFGRDSGSTGSPGSWKNLFTLQGETFNVSGADTDRRFTIHDNVSNASRLVVNGAGYVGIGTTSPQTTLQVAGIISPATNNTYSLGNATYRFTEVYATNGTINTSDRREKKDIYDTDLGLDFINKLRPVSYRWKTGVDDDVHYGLIAQEAEQVIAETGKGEKTSIVTHDETTDRYGVRYSELISPLIKAVQELYNRFLGVDREIASVKAENATIKQENAELKARLDQQEKELAAIKNKLGL